MTIFTPNYTPFRWRWIVVLMVFHSFAFAQHWNKTSHDFGRQKNWNNPTAYFLVTNTTNQTIFFLPTHYDPYVQILFEKKEINPGETLELQIRYFTPYVGKFDINVPIYLSNNRKPIQLQLKGIIISMDQSAMQECPRIENNAQSLSNMRVIHHFEMVNGKTGEPIKGAQVRITSRYSSEKYLSKNSAFSTQRKQPELVVVVIEKEGYEPYEADVYIGKNQNSTLIRLQPIVNHQPAIKEILEEEKTDNQPKEDPEKSQKWTDKMLEKWTDLTEKKEDEKPLAKNDDIEEKVHELDIENFDWSTLKRNDQQESENTDKEEKKQETPEKIVQEEKPKIIIAENDEKAVPEKTILDTKKDTAIMDDKGQLNRNLFVDNHLTFIVDISKSMDHPEKIPLLKMSMINLVKLLRPEDRVTLITYSTESTVLLEAVSGDRKNEVIRVIESLKAGGQSYGDDAVNLAYEVAIDNFIQGGNNEIILVTDGIFNTPKFKTKRMERFVSRQYKNQGILMSTIGFGRNNHAHNFLLSLANKGMGSYIRVNTLEDIENGIVSNVLSHSRK
jgi:Mg-chelatase subunit ChlD